jgi:sortase B
MFTPLVELKNKEVYEDNKFFSLYLENTERKYELVGILKYSVTDEPLYQVGVLDEAKFNEYREYIYKNRLYDTGVEINDDDKLLSLQTCVRNEDNSRWLIVGKLIEEKGIQ